MEGEKEAVEVNMESENELVEANIEGQIYCIEKKMLEESWKSELDIKSEL